MPNNQSAGDTRSEDSAAVDPDRENNDDPLLVLQTPSIRTSQQCRILVLPEVAALFYFLALVNQYPVVQYWLYDHFSKEYHLVVGNDSGACSNNSDSNSTTADLEKKVQAETNNYVMYSSFVGNFVAIFPTLFLGPFTDKYGRKFVFYVSLAGLFCNLLMNLFVFYFDLTPALVCVASLFLGLSGNYGLFLVASFGMVADLTTPGKERAFRVTTMEATLAIAASISTVTAGIWVKELGYIWPMAFAIGEVVLATLFVVFLLPETQVERHYRPFSCKTLLKSFNFYIKDTQDKRRFRLLAYMLCFLIMLWAFIGESNFGTLYLLHQPFCWPKVQISVFNGVFVFLRWLVVLGLIILGRRCISESVFAMMGSASAATGYLLRGLAQSDLLIFIGMGASVIMDLVGPMCRTLLSRSVSRDEQGALFAGIGVLQMIVSAVSGVVMSTVYGAGLDIYLGLPYLVLSGMIWLNIFILLAAIIHGRRHPAAQQQADEEERLIA